MDLLPGVRQEGEEGTGRLDPQARKWRDWNPGLRNTQTLSGQVLRGVEPPARGLTPPASASDDPQGGAASPPAPPWPSPAGEVVESGETLTSWAT